MRLFDRICPICGYKNGNLDLEETGGWMECAYCGELLCFPVPAADEGNNDAPRPPAVPPLRRVV